MRKIYCRYCKHVRDDLNLNMTHTNCAHPSNVTYEDVDTFYEHLVVPRYKKTADELNRNNDCPNYK